MSDTVAYLLASAVYFADLIFLGAAFWLLTEPPGMEELWSRSGQPQTKRLHQLWEVFGCVDRNLSENLVFSLF